MNNEILLIFQIPAINQTIDLIISEELSIQEFKLLLKDLITQVTRKKFTLSGNELICVRETKEVLDDNRFLHEYHLKNGYHLYLI